VSALKTLVTGGTGFVGTKLTGKLTAKGFKVTVLTRSIGEGQSMAEGISFLEGDPRVKGGWQERVADYDIIINLAGASIFSRWTAKRKRLIRDSRILTTRNLVDAISRRKGKKTILLSTSAVGYYGFHGDEALDEGSPAGDDFLATLSQDWESSALEAEKYGVRVVCCRFGIVLGSSGGTLAAMVPLFKKGLGSPLGGGNQWVSWIHEEDLANIHLFLIERDEISGPVNCTAPNPVTNRELTKVLGEILGKPTFLPAVPGFILKLKMGEFGSVLLNGQKVLPKRLLEQGYKFHFENLREALEDLLEGK
jgi:uncharacterized protein (TIGR01777 family)